MRTDTLARGVHQEQHIGGSLEPLGPVPFVQPAPLLEVMAEQLTYLAGHATGACPWRCAECARLEQVKRWLLAPFA